MSYCVHCGVELEKSINECPLCHTPVVDPNTLISGRQASPFPERSGKVEVVKRKDFAILLSVVLLSTSLTCLLLNFLVFDSSNWSFLIIGICAIIWVFSIPAVIYTKLPIYASILFDGIVVCIFLWLISFVTPSDDWLYDLAIPITILTTLLVEIMAYFLRRFRISFLATALYLFAEIPILCVGIEILINAFADNPYRLTWSAVVLTVCTIIDGALITLISKKRFRDAVRRRLHF